MKETNTYNTFYVVRTDHYLNYNYNMQTKKVEISYSLSKSCGKPFGSFLEAKAFAQFVVKESDPKTAEYIRIIQETTTTFKQYLSF